MSPALRAIVAVSALCTLSCATGAETRLFAPQSPVPISLSQSIVDERGSVYRPRPDEIVGHFKRSWRSWDWFYGLVSINADVDLTRLVAAEVEKRNGDAVINLRVRSNYAKTWYVTAVLVVLPDSVGVTVEGDVIRRQPDVSAEPEI